MVFERPLEHSQPLGLGFLGRDSLRHLVKPRLGGIVPRHKAVVIPLILPLVLGNAGVLGNTVLGHLHQHRQFLLQTGFLLLQLRGVAERLPDEPGIGGNLFPLRHQLVEGRDESRFDFLFGHMGRLALMPVVFVVATVDGAPVLVGAVPDLGSKEAAALAAFDFPGENAHAAVSASLPLAPRHLRLHHLEGFRGDDGRMALLHEVAGDLPAVLDGLLGKEVRREGLLDAGAARVLLVGEDSVDGGGVPLGFARDRQDSPLGQFLGDGAWGQSFDEQSEDEPHGLGLFLIDGKVAVLPFVVAEKAGVAHGEFAVSKLFSQPPCDVLRNAPRLLLTKRREDCE